MFINRCYKQLLVRKYYCCNSYNCNLNIDYDSPYNNIYKQHITEDYKNVIDTVNKTNNINNTNTDINNIDNINTIIEKLDNIEYKLYNIYKKISE